MIMILNVLMLLQVPLEPQASQVLLVPRETPASQVPCQPFLEFPSFDY